MIKQLQKKFIRIAMVSLTAAVFLVAAGINVMNWLNVRSEIRETARYRIAVKIRSIFRSLISQFR